VNGRCFLDKEKVCAFWLQSEGVCDYNNPNLFVAGNTWYDG
ncbi:uncharacterized protein METZ01_LOCUS410050, partial [marine metagenome]